MDEKQAKAIARQALGDKRYQHTLNVKKMAVKLAKKYGADETKAAVAALLHDAAKERPKEELLAIIKENPAWAENAADRPTPVWHGICAAILARKEWGVEDEEILSAIACHTTGRPGMSLLDKIIFLADMTSAERDWPGVEELRKLEMKDIDLAMLEGLEQTLGFVEQGGKAVDPTSRAAYEDLARTYYGQRLTHN